MVPKMVVPSTKVTDPVVILRTLPTPFTVAVRVIRRSTVTVLDCMVKTVTEAYAPGTGAGAGVSPGAGGWSGGGKLAAVSVKNTRNGGGVGVGVGVGGGSEHRGQLSEWELA